MAQRQQMAQTRTASKTKTQTTSRQRTAASKNAPASRQRTAASRNASASKNASRSDWYEFEEDKKASKKNTKNKKQKKKKKRRIPLIGKFFIVLILLFLVFLGFYYGSGIGGRIDTLRAEAHKLVRASNEETFRASQTSQVYDHEGGLISTLKGDKNLYYLEFDDIPTYVKTAFVSIEDKKFYSHGGVDYKAVLRAIISYVKNGKITQGGSTITQQLSRNIFLSHEVSWERKAEEIFIARDLEKIYSKNKILEYYINNIYFANGNYGIQAASKSYFNKDVHDLSLSQTAFLCAIPNNPTLYDPMTNMENTIKRRDRILKQMEKDGVISETDCTAAINEDIILDIPVNDKSDYVETFVYYCATRALMKENGFEFRYAFASDADRKEYEEEYSLAYNTTQKTLFTSGYKIYTSIDMTMQDQLQSAVDTQLSEFTETGEDGVYKLQAAASCIDNASGLVTAVVGGRSQQFSGYTLNRAYQSFRQPGSSIKPLIVYTPSLENGYTANSSVSDTKIKDGPSNSGDSYEGTISLRRAVAKSKNTVAWKLFEELTPKKGLSYLTEMEFSKIVDDDFHLPSALGGFTKGTSSVEMSGAYAALANDGLFRSPSCIMRITDADGNVLYQANTIGKQVYKRNAARSMTDLLQSVIKEGTGRGLEIDNMPCAGKTGTTNDNKDGWFAGYTPYYTTTVWVGYDMPKKLPGLQGASYPGAIWKQFMNTIHQGLERKEFPEPTAEKTKKPSEEEQMPSEEPQPIQEAPTAAPAATTAPVQTPTPTPKATAKPKATPTPTTAPEPVSTPEPQPTQAPLPTAPPNTPVPIPTEMPEEQQQQE